MRDPYDSFRVEESPGASLLRFVPLSQAEVRHA
jgi:hypothetical protein